jgi:SulP family sulfate permease
VVLSTFLLVVLRDLTEGILVGFGLGALLFLHRMARAVEVEVGRDRPDTGNGRGRYAPETATDPDVAVYRISGAFFFGAAASVGAVLDRMAEHPRAYVLDVSGVPVLDSTAAATIAGFVRKAERRGAAVYVAGARPSIRRVLLTHGVRPPHVRFRSTLDGAVAAARSRSADRTPRGRPAAGAQ